MSIDDFAIEMRRIWKIFGACVHANQVSKNGGHPELNHAESIKIT